jgi:glucose/arabinose dehydrogenase
MPGLGLVSRAIVVLSIAAGCTTGTAGGATAGGVGAAAAGSSIAQRPEAVKPPEPSSIAAAPQPASYSVGHLALTLQKLAGTAFTDPVAIANAHDGSGRLFVVEKAGRIRIIDGSTIVATPFLDIRSIVGSTGDEQGLLGVAFHPLYSVNGRFFVYYTDKSGNIQISEYHRDPADANRALTGAIGVLHITHPYTNHNGGTLAFGPDGLLYIGTGDGGSAGDPGNRAQNKSNLLGKILRININHWASGLHYSNPPSNPFVGTSGDDRVWAYGLRNPWKFSFDRTTGDLWIGDVGQDRYEEIDRATKAGGLGRARNYGWRVMEGRACYNPSSGCSTAGKTKPIAVYSHSNGCAVVGGYVYRGSLYPDMANAYLFSDYCSGKIWALVNQASSQTPQLIKSSGLMVSAFGEGEDGTLYVADLAGGGIYRLVGSHK